MDLKYLAPTNDVGQAVSIVNWWLLWFHDNPGNFCFWFLANKVRLWVIWTTSPFCAFDFVLGIFFLSPVKNEERLFKFLEESLEEDADPAVPLSDFFGLFGHFQGGCLLQSQSHFFLPDTKKINICSYLLFGNNHNLIKNFKYISWQYFNESSV